MLDMEFPRLLSSQNYPNTNLFGYKTYVGTIFSSACSWPRTVNDFASAGFSLWFKLFIWLFFFLSLWNNWAPSPEPWLHSSPPKPLCLHLLPASDTDADTTILPPSHTLTAEEEKLFGLYPFNSCRMLVKSHSGTNVSAFLEWFSLKFRLKVYLKVVDLRFTQVN